MINFDFNKYCYGCRNCENICPVNAIKMIENKEGFLIPQIDNEKCINCGACDKKCPYLNYKEYGNLKEKTWYGAYNKEKKEREKSTSGAIFPAIAEYFLKNNGLVVGCVWNEDMKPVHILTDKIEDVNRMRGSKYLQSDMQNVINKIKSEIDKRKVLFTGTPCQVAAVKLHIGEHKNLYTCGLICEGVGSYKIWKKYVEVLEKKYNSKMINASFRNKEIGWNSPVAVYEFLNNKVRKTLSFEFDPYVRGFLQSLYYRNSCSNCQYKGNGHNSDILIGDLWGATREQLQETEYKGISAVILNSNKGIELFDVVKSKISHESIEPEKVIKFNALLMKPKEKNANRDNFFEKLDEMNIVKNINQNVYEKKTKRISKEILYKIKLFKVLKRLKNGGK